MNRILLLLGFGVLGAPWTPCAAQDPVVPESERSGRHRIHLRNGNILEGTVETATPDTVQLRYAPNMVLRLRVGEIQRDRDGRLMILELGPDSHPAVKPEGRKEDAAPAPKREGEVAIQRPEPSSAAVTLLAELERAVDRGPLLERLAKLRSRELAEAVSLALASGSPAVDAVLAEVVRRKDPHMFPVLREGLKSVQSGHALAAVVRASADLGVPGTNDAVRRLLGHSAPEVRGAAAYALGHVGDKHLLRSITPLLTDPDAETRRHAADALVFAARRLDAAGTVVTEIQRMLPRTAGDRLDMVLMVLAQLKTPEAAEVLLELAGHSRANVRASAVRAMSGVRSEGVITYLKTALGAESDPEVRTALGGTLVAHGDREFRLPLLAALEVEGDDRVRAILVNALTRMTGRKFGNDVAAWRRWLEENP